MYVVIAQGAEDFFVSPPAEQKIISLMTRRTFFIFEPLLWKVGICILFKTLISAASQIISPKVEVKNIQRVYIFCKGEGIFWTKMIFFIRSANTI